jgi:hypothetical protein
VTRPAADIDEIGGHIHDALAQGVAGRREPSSTP